MTQYEVKTVAENAEFNLSPKDIIVGTVEKSGTIYVVYLRIKAGVRQSG